MLYRKFVLFSFALLFSVSAAAQFSADELGGWLTYVGTGAENEQGIGMQTLLQWRDLDIGSGQNLLIAAAAGTWTPEDSPVRYALGVKYLRSDDGRPASGYKEEWRLYEDAFLRHKPAAKFFVAQRFRLEQRWLPGQQSHRLRYFLSLNYPLNRPDLKQGAVYLALFNELYLNLDNDAGSSGYALNQTYAALGYSLSDALRLQFGYLYQHSRKATTGHLQLGIYHLF